MANPNLSQLHVSHVLTDFSIEYMQDGGWVGQELAPFVRATHPVDQYDILGKESMMLLETEVAPTAIPPLFEWTNAQGTFSVDYHRLSAVVPWHLQKAATGSFENRDLKLVNTRGISRIMKLGHEYRVMQACVGAATTFTSVALAGVNRWDTATGTPINDVRKAKQTIRTGCQAEANVMVIPINVLEALQTNPQIQNYITYTTNAPIGQAHVVTKEILQGLFGIDRILIAEAQYINAPLNAVATTAPTFVWDTNCFIAHVDPAVMVGMMSALKTFVFPWVGDSIDAVVRDLPEEKYLWDFLDILWAYDIAITATGAGYAIQTCIS